MVGHISFKTFSKHFSLKLADPVVSALLGKDLQIINILWIFGIIVAEACCCCCWCPERSNSRTEHKTSHDTRKFDLMMVAMLLSENILNWIGIDLSNFDRFTWSQLLYMSSIQVLYIWLGLSLIFTSRLINNLSLMLNYQDDDIMEIDATLWAIWELFNINSLPITIVSHLQQPQLEHIFLRYIPS